MTAPAAWGIRLSLGEVEDGFLAVWDELARYGSLHPLEAVTDGKVRPGRNPWHWCV